MWMIHICCVITYTGNFFSTSDATEFISLGVCMLFEIMNVVFFFHLRRFVHLNFHLKKKREEEKRKIHAYNSDNNQQNDLSIVIGEQKMPNDNKNEMWPCGGREECEQ